MGPNSLDARPLLIAALRSRFGYSLIEAAQVVHTFNLHRRIEALDESGGLKDLLHMIVPVLSEKVNHFIEDWMAEEDEQ